MPKEKTTKQTPIYAIRHANKAKHPARQLPLAYCTTSRPDRKPKHNEEQKRGQLTRVFIHSSKTGRVRCLLLGSSRCRVAEARDPALKALFGDLRLAESEVQV
jgi:hypothetical protein